MVSRVRARRGRYSSVVWNAMRLAVVLALGAALGSCAFAVKHPAITTAIAGAVIAGGTCELAITASANGAKGNQGACAIATGAVGLGLGLVVAAAIWLGGDGHTILVEEPLSEPPAPIKVFKQAPPADAGVALAIDATELVIDATP